MGQYYIICDLDRKEYLNPHAFGDGVKLLEFGCSQNGTLMALAILLADGSGRGGGDLISENPALGSWKGDRIVVTGDYADHGNFVTDEDAAAYVESIKKHPIQKEFNASGLSDYEHYLKYHTNEDGVVEKPNLHDVAGELWKDISVQALAAILDDEHIRGETEKQLKGSGYMSNREELAQALKLRKKYRKHNWLQSGNNYICDDCGKLSYNKKPPESSYKNADASVEEEEKPEKPKVDLPDDGLQAARDEAFRGMA